MLGLAGLDVVVVIGDRRIRLATHEWAGGVVDPRGHEHLAGFDLDDGVPRWRYDLGAVQRRGRGGDGARRQCRRRRAPPPGRATHASRSPRCAPGATSTVSGSPGADPQVEPTPSGFVFESAYRVHGPGLPARRRVVPRRLPPRGGGPGARRDRGPLGGGHVPRRPARRRGRSRCRPRPSSACRPRTPCAIVAAARARAPRPGRAVQGRHDDVDRILAVAADRFVVQTPTGPDGRGRLPVVRRVVPRPVHLVRGPVPVHRPRRRGPRGPGQGGRHASPRACWPTPPTSGRSSTTPSTPRCGSCTRSAATSPHTGDLDLAAELSDTVVEHPDRAPRRHPVRHRRRSRHRAAARRRRRVGPDVDGRPGRRAPGHAAGRASRSRSRRSGSTAWGDRCGPAGAGRAGRRRVGAVAAGRDSGVRAAVSRAATAGLPDLVDDVGHRRTRAAGRTSSWRPRCPTARFATRSGSRPSSPPCGAELLTSVGLRSLAPVGPRLPRRHRGGPAERDRAYHQGTVWPWLIGPYADAVRRAGGDTTGLLDGLQLHLAEFGLGSVSETAGRRRAARRHGMPLPGVVGRRARPGPVDGGRGAGASGGPATRRGPRDLTVTTTRRARAAVDRAPPPPSSQPSSPGG